jgi:RNA polymerase sigma-70 factor (ECF subfamily)
MFSEDREYIERILAGEPEAFEFLVRKYTRFGAAVAFAITGDHHLAEDVVQESFVKALDSLGSLREPEKFRYWFGGLVRSKSLDCLRRRRAHGTIPLEDTGESGVSRESPVEAELERDELRERILEAIVDLPEQDRLVVVLKHLEGLSYREIAELLETTVSAVESRLFRARQTLRRKLPAGTS